MTMARCWTIVSKLAFLLHNNVQLCSRHDVVIFSSNIANHCSTFTSAKIEWHRGVKVALVILLSAVDRNSIVDIFSRTHRSNQHLTHQAGHCTGETFSVNFSLFCVIPRLTLRFYSYTYCSPNPLIHLLFCKAERTNYVLSTFFFCERYQVHGHSGCWRLGALQEPRTQR